MAVPASMPSAGVRSTRSSSDRRCRWAAMARAPYSTKLPSSHSWARFSRAVRRPVPCRLSTAAAAALVPADRVALEHLGEIGPDVSRGRRRPRRRRRRRPRRRGRRRAARRRSRRCRPAATAIVPTVPAVGAATTCSIFIASRTTRACPPRPRRPRRPRRTTTVPGATAGTASSPRPCRGAGAGSAGSGAPTSTNRCGRAAARISARWSSRKSVVSSPAANAGQPTMPASTSRFVRHTGDVHLAQRAPGRAPRVRRRRTTGRTRSASPAAGRSAGSSGSRRSRPRRRGCPARTAARRR